MLATGEIEREGKKEERGDILCACYLIANVEAVIHDATIVLGRGKLGLVVFKNQLSLEREKRGRGGGHIIADAGKDSGV